MAPWLDVHVEALAVVVDNDHANGNANGTVPLSVWAPEPGEAWPCPMIPLLVNVIHYPQPTAARCSASGQALGRAIRSYPKDITVGVLGTGGMSHQLAGARAGCINPEFDAMWMEAIGMDPARPAALSCAELVRQAGSEGIELIMRLVMREAMDEQVTKVYSDSFVCPRPTPRPASRCSTTGPRPGTPHRPRAVRTPGTDASRRRDD